MTQILRHKVDVSDLPLTQVLRQEGKLPKKNLGQNFLVLFFRDSEESAIKFFCPYNLLLLGT